MTAFLDYTIHLKLRLSGQISDEQRADLSEAVSLVIDASTAREAIADGLADRIDGVEIELENFYKLNDELPAGGILPEDD
jgi:hypothetical protein